MGLSSRTFGWLSAGLGNEEAAREIESRLSGLGDVPGKHWYVDAQNGGAGNDGRSWSRAFLTMTAAFAVVGDNDVIHLRGPIFENLTAPSGVTGVTIVGDGSGLRHGSTTNVAEGFAPSWRTASGVTTEPLLILHSQGWTIADILMAPGTSDYAIELQSDAGASPEKTCSGTRILGCRFAGGAGGINDNGGAGFVTVKGCRFESHTTGGIVNTSTANALPLQWDVTDNIFANGNAHHIDAPASKWTISRNVFHTVSGSDHYIDLTDGGNNIVGPHNVFAGTYAHADYQDATGDVWAGNYTDAGVTAANPAA